MLEYFGNQTLCLSRRRFHLSSVCPCEKTLQKGKKLFKVSLLSLLKDLLINCFWENLSFCQFILIFSCDLRKNFQTLTGILFLGKVTIQFLPQLHSHGNKARLKFGKAKSTSQSSGFTYIFQSLFGGN